MRLWFHSSLCVRIEGEENLFLGRAGLAPALRAWKAGTSVVGMGGRRRGGPPGGSAVEVAVRLELLAQSLADAGAALLQALGMLRLDHFWVLFHQDFQDLVEAQLLRIPVL